MAFVKVFVNGNTQEDRDKALEKALNAFRKQVAKEGIVQEVKKREEYLPPSVTKRIKRKEAIKRANKLARKRQRFFQDK